MEMQRFDGRAKEEDQGAVALVLDLAKTFERVSLPVVWALGDAFHLPKGNIAGAVWLVRAPEARTVRSTCGRAAHDHHGYLARSKWSCLLLRIVLQDASNEVTKI